MKISGTHSGMQTSEAPLMDVVDECAGASVFSIVYKCHSCAIWRIPLNLLVIQWWCKHPHSIQPDRVAHEATDRLTEFILQSV